MSGIIGTISFQYQRDTQSIAYVRNHLRARTYMIANDSWILRRIILESFDSVTAAVNPST